MKKIWFRVLQLGAAATLMTASASAVTRALPATAISTYQNANCFYKNAGDLRLSTSNSCRFKSLDTWMPVEVDPSADSFSAEVYRLRENKTSCDDADVCVGAFTLNQKGQVFGFSGFQCAVGNKEAGWQEFQTGVVNMPGSDGTAAVAFRTFAPSDCDVAYGRVSYSYAFD